MTTTTKTIDLQDLPATERLTLGRKLAASQGKPVLFNGCIVVNEQNINTKAQSLADAPATYRLTQARIEQSGKKTVPTDAPVGAGGELLFNDTGEILGFCSFN
jgi:hypothetical protein